MFTAGNIHYELSDRVRGLGPGGIGAMHLLARRTGHIEAIDRRLHLLKVHLPYHEPGNLAGWRSRPSRAAHDSNLPWRLAVPERSS